MQRHKGLFGRKTNRYFNYRTGTIRSGRSFSSMIFVPVFIIMFTGSLLIGGYIYLNRHSITVKAQSQTVSEAPKKLEKTQEQIDQEALTAKEDLRLAESITQKIESMPEITSWSVSVRDLNSGRMANVDADKKMRSASLYKLFLLSALESRLSSDYWGSYIYSNSVKNCVTLMIKVSDNPCAKNLGAYLGWDRVDSHNQDLGFKNTKLADKSNQITTAREVSELMYRLQNRQILSDKARRIVFDSLYEQKFRNGIAAGCGSECLVANKTGDLDGYRHDAAIVTHGSAKYVLVIMTKNASWSQIADLAKSIDLEMLP